MAAQRCDTKQGWQEGRTLSRGRTLILALHGSKQSLVGALLQLTISWKKLVAGLASAIPEAPSFPEMSKRFRLLWAPVSSSEKIQAWVPL